jgi:hypothetical protein
MRKIGIWKVADEDEVRKADKKQTKPIECKQKTTRHRHNASKRRHSIGKMQAKDDTASAIECKQKTTQHRQLNASKRRHSIGTGLREWRP